jgi:predicted nucleic acid-binding protein
VTRFVIGPDVAVRLAASGAEVAEGHQLLAPTLIRSQVLALLYAAARRGELTDKDAERRLTYLRWLNLRLLGDRVLQRTAWQVAQQLGWDDTYVAEYVALTQLQADAFMTLDMELAESVRGLVTVASVEELL